MYLCLFSLNPTYQTSVPSTSGDVEREGVTSAQLDEVRALGSGTQGPDYGHLEKKGTETRALVYLAKLFRYVSKIRVKEDRTMK